MCDRTKCLIAIAAVTAISVASFADQPRVPESGAVSVKSFADAEGITVIGLLGRPLGTIVRVTGVAVHGTTRDVKASQGDILLTIETVDGKSLKEQVTFLRQAGDAEIKGLSSGDRFDFFCHEAGSFQGNVRIPQGLGIDDRPVQGAGFRYVPRIVIHRRVAKK